MCVRVRDRVQPCPCSTRHTVYPHMWEMLCLDERTDLISYVETVTRAQKQMFDPQHTVSEACSPLHSVCLAVPLLPVEEKGWSSGGSVVYLHTVNLQLGLCGLPYCFLCSGSSDLIIASKDERHQQTRLLCINKFLGNWESMIRWFLSHDYDGFLFF